MEQVKKYGEYYVNVNPQELEQLNELEVWDIIREMELELKYNAMDPMLGHCLSSSKVINYEYDLQYIIYFTRKFGVQFDCEPSEKRIEKSESFNKWYAFYEKLIEDMKESGLYAEYLKDKQLHNSLDKYMPTTSWKEHTR
ncbi:MAG: hypothetical protein IKX00_02590 [Bacilli bacterium]|nr:hypothetical protein [Bacilli bacterium]